MDKSRTAKTRIEVTLSEKALAEVQSIAAELNVSVSELLEQVGQGELVIVDAEAMEEIEDRLDLEEGERRLADPAEVPIPYEQVRKELGLA